MRSFISFVFIWFFVLFSLFFIGFLFLILLTLKRKNSLHVLKNDSQKNIYDYILQIQRMTINFLSIHYIYILESHFFFIFKFKIIFLCNQFPITLSFKTYSGAFHWLLRYEVLNLIFMMMSIILVLTAFSPSDIHQKDGRNVTYT